MGHVAITGASSGLGAALAEELARRGHAVTLIARRQGLLDALAARIVASGGRAAVAVADVTERDAVAAAVRAGEAVHGPVDVMIANAGGGEPAPIDRWDGAKVVGAMRLNYDGVVWAFDAVLPAMLARRSGQLVAISSIAAWRGLPKEGAYCASKAAVTTLCESLGAELGGRGIAITCVHPGFMNTPMHPDPAEFLPLKMEPAAAAVRIANGIERRRRTVDFPWLLVWAMRLARVLPALLVDRLVVAAG
jgi:short-subunit dehydrogenase